MDQRKLIALVVGVGPIGLAIVQGLKAQGVETIVAADVSSKRRESAAYFGATLVLDPIQADLVSHVRGLTIDGGASIAFECSGVQAGFDSAVAATRPGGTTVIVSQWMQRANFDIFDVMLHEKHLVGAVVYERKDFEAVIKAIDSGMSDTLGPPCLWQRHDLNVDLECSANVLMFQGKIQPGSMVTSKIRMDQVAEKGFKALIEERDLHVKILVEVGDIPTFDV